MLRLTPLLLAIVLALPAVVLTTVVLTTVALPTVARADGPATGSGPSSGPLSGTVSATVRLDEMLRIVAQEHEAQQRIDPMLLLQGALEAAADAIEPLLFEPARIGARDRLRLRVGARAASYDLAQVDTLPRLAALLDEMRAFIETALPAEDRPGYLATVLAEGMLRALDPHSSVLSATAYGDFQSRASGHIGGLGMRLRSVGHGLTVDEVLPGSPAHRAGVLAGDRVLQIGPHTALEMPTDQALGHIRGPVGTQVRLLVLRPGEAAPRPLALRRTSLRSASVESRALSAGGGARIGYLGVRSFQDTTADELLRQVRALQAGRGALLGLVLDLRGNSGGVLEQAIRAADVFLDRGTIVTLRGPRVAPEAVPARWYRSVTSAPLIVLVDGGTASAAEIVAAALQLNHRALVLGTPTFGKDTIQSVFPLSGGNALKLTVARFRAPGAGGARVVPHIVLAPVWLPAEGGSAAGMAEAGLAATGLLAAALEAGAADAGRGGAAHPARTLPYLVGAAGPADPADDPPDAALAYARRLLRLNGPQGQSILLSRAFAWVHEERLRQDRRIAERLGAAGIDWSAGIAGAGGQVELQRVTVEQRRGAGDPWAPLLPGGQLTGGDHVRLRVTVRNPGALPLHRVLVTLESAIPTLAGLELPVGHVPAGESMPATLEARLPLEPPAGREPLALGIYDGRRQLHYRATVLLPLQPAPRAALRVDVAVRDDGWGDSRGDGDGRAQAGETIALRVRVRNDGPGTSGAGRYWLSSQDDARVHLVRGWQPFGALPAGMGAEGRLGVELRLPLQARPEALALHLMEDRHPGRVLVWRLRPAPDGRLPNVSLVPPAVRIAATHAREADEAATLHGSVSDDEGVRDLTIYRDGRKLQHVQAAGVGDARLLPVRLRVPLAPGRNLVRVVARDRDGLRTSDEYVLWRGQGSGFPIAGYSSDPG